MSAVIQAVCIVGDNGLDERFDDGDICAAGGDITRVVDAVSTSRTADTERAGAIWCNFFFDLRVVIRCVFASVHRLVVGLDGVHSVRGS